MSSAKIQQTASTWFVRRNGERASDADEAAFERWLVADPRHAIAYRECEAGWSLLGEAAGSREIGALGADALEAHDRQAMTRRQVLRYGGGGAVAVVLGIGLWTSTSEPAWARYATGPGERLGRTFPNGTELMLAPQSRLTASMDASTSQAKLEAGQVFFQSQDAAVRLIVEAPDCRVEGSQCAVQLGLLDGGSEVIAVSGPISVNGAALAPGHRWFAGTVERIDVGAVTSWRTGRLDFRDRPLREVVAAFNRYGRDQFVIADTIAGDTAISGSFRYDAAGAFPQALEEIFGLRVEPAGEHRWRIATAP